MLFTEPCAEYSADGISGLWRVWACWL